MEASVYGSRRRFIETLLGLAGSASLAGAAPWVGALGLDEPGVTTAPNKIRIGLIGAGSRGRTLLEHLVANHGVEVAAVCDPYEPHLRLGLKLAGPRAKGFADHRKMLETKGLHAVVVATPLHLHAGQCLDSFAAGKHVFCEKSVAMTVRECHELLSEHRKSGLIFQPGHQRLFDIRYLRALEMTAQGDLGQITQIKAYWHRNGDWRRDTSGNPALERALNWRLYREYSLGLMTELASHHLQVANWFLGSTPIEVMGSGGINFWKDGREVYDNVNLVYVYPKGIHVLYDSVISNRRHGSEIKLLGSKGSIDMETQRFFSEKPPATPAISQLVHDIENRVFRTIPVGGASWVPETASAYEGEPLIDRPSSRIPDSTQLSLEAFVTSVRENKVIPGLAEHGINAAMAVILGQKAMETGQRVRFADEVTP